MKRLFLVLVILSLFTACAKSYDSGSAPAEMPTSYKSRQENKSIHLNQTEGAVAGSAADGKLANAPTNDSTNYFKKASAEDTPINNSTQAQAPIERKIIRNGELDLEVEKPSDIANKIAGIASSLGGFVVTSESQQIGQNATRMSVVVRVASSKFDQAMKDIRALVGEGKVLREKSSGVDVTEEFVDLQARLRAKQALENQFLEILKKATKISEMLEVQNSLNAVRTEIEQIEGRLRYLENQSSLSTITLTLQTPQALVVQSTKGFFSEFKAAVSDGIEISQSIVLGLIRLMGILVPLIAFLGTPLYIAYRLIRKKLSKTL